MLTYKAAYTITDEGVHAQVVDFPEVISCGTDLDDARRMLASALIDVSEFRLDRGQPLPVPNPLLSDATADLEEPIHLHLRASSAVAVSPVGTVVP